MVCVQNGVENERLALRLFAGVYGAVVMSPTAHMQPGVVQGYGTRLSGVIDLGRYPPGSTIAPREIAQAIGSVSLRVRSPAGHHALQVREAGLEPGQRHHRDLRARRRRETSWASGSRRKGAAVLDAAGIDHAAGDVDDVLGRWERYGVGDIGGSPRHGSSTWQSIARGASAIETDYLNGEIVLIGRMHGVPAPLNQALCELAERHTRRATCAGDAARP